MKTQRKGSPLCGTLAISRRVTLSAKPYNESGNSASRVLMYLGNIWSWMALLFILISSQRKTSSQCLHTQSFSHSSRQIFLASCNLLKVSGLKHGDLIEGLEHKSPGKCYVIESVSIFWCLPAEYIPFSIHHLVDTHLPWHSERLLLR